MACFAKWAAAALLVQQVACAHLRSLSNASGIAGGALSDFASRIERGDSIQAFRQTLRNHGDVQYTGEIQVGSQKLRGILDTGSFELLVLSKECDACGDTTKLYNHDRSHNFKRGDSVAQHNFGSGVTFSKEAFDTVKAGPLVAKQQHFWEVFDARMPILKESTFQAIVGVGPPDSAVKLADEQDGKMMAVATGFRSLTEDPDEELKISKDPLSICSKFGIGSFSVCIGQEAGSPGYFVWNDQVQDRHGTFTSVPVKGEIHWATELSDVRMGHSAGDSLIAALGCADGCAAVIDSGTSLIAAPTEVIAQVDRALSNLAHDCSNLGDMPDLVFNLGGHEFSLPPDAYIGQVVHNGKPALSDLLHFRFQSRHYSCVPLFMDIDTDTQLGPMWILGLPFFRKYYTSFRFDSSSHPVQKHLSIALADDDCYPTSGSALLTDTRRRNLRPREIEISDLRVPEWAEAAMSRKYFPV